MKRPGNNGIAKKRIIALMLSLALLFATLPGAAVAQPEGLVGYEPVYVQENYELVTDEASESEEHAVDEDAADAAGSETEAGVEEAAIEEVVTKDAEDEIVAISEAADEITTELVEAYGYVEIEAFSVTVSNSVQLHAAMIAAAPGERIYLAPNFELTHSGAQYGDLPHFRNHNVSSNIDVVIASGLPGGAVQTIQGTGARHLMNFQFTEPVLDVTLTFDNVIFENTGSIRYFGGDVRVAGATFGTLTVNNLVMQNGRSFTNGGFLHSPANSLAHFIVNDSTFTNGVSPNAGGAIFSANGSVTVNNSTFTDNTANGAAGGGAIHATPVHINNSTFEGNSAPLAGGGAISTGGGTVTNTDFENNTARNGGALLSSGTMNVTNSTFVDNTATITQAALDAIIFGVDPDPIINPNPLPQWALDAGWTSWTEIFTYSMGGGGAINHGGPGLLTVRDSDFVDNVSAINGGSIWARADHRDVWCDNGEDARGAGVDCGNFYSGNTPPQYFESCAFPTVTFRFYTRSADGTVTAHVGTLTRADIPVGTTITLAMVPTLAGFPGADFLPAAFKTNYTAVVVVEDTADNMVRVVFVAQTPEVTVPNNPCPNDPTQECECPEPPPVPCDVCSQQPCICCDDCESHPCECDTEVLETEEESDTGTDRRRPAGEGPKTGDNTNFFAQIAAMAALVVTVAVTGLVRTREQD